MNASNMPGFTAEKSLGNTSGRYRLGAALYLHSSSGSVQPAAMSTCQRLGQASWAAYDRGDFRTVQSIDWLMTLVGCFD